MSAFEMAPVFETVPRALAIAWIGALGLIVGSFLNVVIHRLPRGTSLVLPPSSCPSCGAGIRWFHNIPVASWLWLRGRCAACRAPISARYPAVEALTGALFVCCLFRFGLTVALVPALVFMSLLIALVFTDLAHFLLPDALTLPGAWAGLAFSFLVPLPTPSEALLGVLTGIFVMEGLNFAFKLVRHKDGFGFGDTKMMMLMGAFLGWEGSLLALVLGTVLGSLVAIPLLLLQRRRSAAPSEDSVDGEEQAVPSSAWRDLVPSDARDVFIVLTFLLLAASFVTPTASPARSTVALLVAVLAGTLAGKLTGSSRPLWRRLWPALFALVASAGALLPALGGVLVSCATAGLALGAVVFLARHGHPDAIVRPEEPEDEAAVTASLRAPAPTLMQQAIPFGVYLGAGAAIALLGGDELIEWYVRTAPSLIGN